MKNYNKTIHVKYNSLVVIMIRVNNKMQKNYVYQRVAPIGGDFDPTFTPFYTPKQMLSMGVFEGKYMRDCHKEYPIDDAKESVGDADPKVNYFGIKSRQSLQVWQTKGWIIGNDPRGWFEWYCRYYYGRRDPDVDAKQIARWRAFRRHQAQVIKNCTHGNPCSQPHNCRPKQRQALLQWSYNCFVGSKQ